MAEQALGSLFLEDQSLLCNAGSMRTLPIALRVSKARKPSVACSREYLQRHVLSGTDVVRGPPMGVRIQEQTGMFDLQQMSLLHKFGS